MRSRSRSRSLAAYDWTDPGNGKLTAPAAGGVTTRHPETKIRIKGWALEGVPRTPAAPETRLETLNRAYGSISATGKPTRPCTGTAEAYLDQPRTRSGAIPHRRLGPLPRGGRRESGSTARRKRRRQRRSRPTAHAVWSYTQEKPRVSPGETDTRVEERKAETPRQASLPREMQRNFGSAAIKPDHGNPRRRVLRSYTQAFQDAPGPSEESASTGRTTRGETRPRGTRWGDNWSHTQGVRAHRECL